MRRRFPLDTVFGQLLTYHLFSAEDEGEYEEAPVDDEEQ